MTAPIIHNHMPCEGCVEADDRIRLLRAQLADTCKMRDAARQLSDAYARRIDELTAARLGHVGDREDPETGAALPAGVEGVSLGRANNGTVKR